MSPLKKLIVFLCIITLTVSVLPLFSSAQKPNIMNDYEWKLLKLTNDERTKVGLKPLSTFTGLQWRADVRCEELYRYFSHTRPNGQSCMSIFDGLRNLNHFGENVAAGYLTPAETLDIWMHSQNGHKENILYPKFSHLATGYINMPDDSKEFFRYWVQSFVGDCSVTPVKCDETPVFDTNGNLMNKDVALEMTCVHGTSYLPLVNTEYVCSSNKYGPATMIVKYNGNSYKFNCAVGYKDISQGAWYYDSVVRATNIGLFSGTSETTFSPNAPMTRAMLVSVLYRIEGSPDVPYSYIFDDVPIDQWYSKAVSWAEDNNIVSGMTRNTFAPNKEVTREQITTILYRYATYYKGVNTSARTSLDSFVDVGYLHDYARDAMQWAVAVELVHGKPGNKLDPLGSATRAEVCMIMVDYTDKIK